MLADSGTTGFTAADNLPLTAGQLLEQFNVLVINKHRTRPFSTNRKRIFFLAANFSLGTLFDEFFPLVKSWTRHNDRSRVEICKNDPYWKTNILPEDQHISRYPEASMSFFNGALFSNPISRKKKFGENGRQNRFSDQMEGWSAGLYSCWSLIFACLHLCTLALNLL